MVFPGKIERHISKILKQLDQSTVKIIKGSIHYLTNMENGDSGLHI